MRCILTHHSMELIKKNIYIILIIAFVLALVVIRNTGTGHFRYDAKRWAKASYSGSNIITRDKLSALHGKLLLLTLGNEQKPRIGEGIRILPVPPDSILAKKYISEIRSNNGPVILYSADYSVSSKIWMVLSQAGFRNIFIYADSAGNEILKKEFRPDSLTRPE
jgi:hypothetical protein